MTQLRLTDAGVASDLKDRLPDRILPSLPAHWTSLGRVFVHNAKRYPDRQAISDSSGQSLSYGETLLQATVLARVLSRKLSDAPYVGLMMPPTVPAVLANIALTLLGKIPVNLNFQSNTEVVNSAVRRCGIKQVITVGPIAKGKVQPAAELVLAEALKSEITADDLAWAVTAINTPEESIGQYLPGVNAAPEDTATVMFTSGSTGEPKGVVLTQKNVLSNIFGVSEHANLKPDNQPLDVILGKLPLYHALGFTITVWCVLSLGQSAVYHPNPVDSRTIGPLMQKLGVTIMASTPTLMRFFLSRCSPEQFKSVRWLLLGSEKLKPELCKDIKSVLGIEPVEGFGCTQLSPVVAANVPFSVKSPDGREVYGNKLGSVGQPIPGTTVVIRAIDTDEIIEPGSIAADGKYREGVIWVNGPQVMKEYLGNPEATAKVLFDGWFNTEDVGYVDADGFLWITDRLSRFAKVGGEMVPLGNIETAIRQLTGVNELAVAVTRLPDAKRGEKPVVVYTSFTKDPAQPVTPEQVCELLKQSGMPALWLPDVRDFVQVDELPVGTTQKLDLKEIEKIAREKLGT
jgi:acyl-[acyl-carrier-protein]-phospholipid O-acyltransferase/long-chain-fatty-acid--[acyl-carrier-protein] ligase